MPAVQAALAARWQLAAAVWIERPEIGPEAGLEAGLGFALSGLRSPARADGSLRPAPSLQAWPSASARRLPPALDQAAAERAGRCAIQPIWRSDRARSRWFCRRWQIELRARAPVLIRWTRSKRFRQTSCSETLDPRPCASPPLSFPA